MVLGRNVKKGVQLKEDYVGAVDNIETDL